MSEMFDLAAAERAFLAYFRGEAAKRGRVQFADIDSDTGWASFRVELLLPSGEKAIIWTQRTFVRGGGLNVVGQGVRWYPDSPASEPMKEVADLGPERCVDRASALVVMESYAQQLLTLLEAEADRA